jgi:hypothetical protein
MFGIPGLIDFRRRTVRAETNPLDKCTVCSIYPVRMDERKPTIEPGRFVIEAGSIEHPQILVVGSSSWWKEIDEEQPLLEIPNSSIQVANSIVTDYCNGLLACNMADSMPGIFWVPGEHTVHDILTKHKAKFDLAVTRQTQFFKNLVRMADIMWARTGGNPLVINDMMRMGAVQLNLKGKEWMKDFTMMGQENCPMCGTPRRPEFPMCPNCRTILDPERAKALGVQFAATPPPVQA